MPPSIPLPEQEVYEWSVFRTHTSTGMYAYRHMQTLNLLEFPDFGGDDLTYTQRREALQGAVAFREPLAAITIFLGVVALEDFIRDLGARLADNTFLQSAFPQITGLRTQPVKTNLNKPFARLDKDPATLVDPEDVNKLFQRCLDVEPFAVPEFPRLRDLALIRHTVAHHAAIIRQIDVQRFQYYIVHPEHPINPPISFVRETCGYLYNVGRSFEESLKKRIFSVILPALGRDWRASRPPELIQLIELFNYFGKLVESVPIGIAPDGTEDARRVQDEETRTKEGLIRLCIEELHQAYP